MRSCKADTASTRALGLYPLAYQLYQTVNDLHLTLGFLLSGVVILRFSTESHRCSPHSSISSHLQIPWALSLLVFPLGQRHLALFLLLPHTLTSVMLAITLHQSRPLLPRHPLCLVLLCAFSIKVVPRVSLPRRLQI